jgi:hypothetical protein
MKSRGQSESQVVKSGIAKKPTVRNVPKQEPEGEITIHQQHKLGCKASMREQSKDVKASDESKQS